MEAGRQVARTNATKVQLASSEINMAPLPKFLLDLPLELVLLILNCLTVAKFPIVNEDKKERVCSTYNLETRDVRLILSVQLQAMYRAYCVNRSFKTLLLRNVFEMRVQRRVFFQTCANAFSERILTGGQWNDTHLLMLLGGHTVVRASLERQFLNNMAYCLYVRLSITNDESDVHWLAGVGSGYRYTPQTTMSRKLRLPGPHVQQYWFFSNPFTAEQTKMVEDWLPAQLFEELLMQFFDMARKRRAEGHTARWYYV
jgi:hypothetical protein